MTKQPNAPRLEASPGLFHDLLTVWRPLLALGAQLIYFGAPILRLFGSSDALESLAAWLEGYEEEQSP
jgi:hypothetical protein